MHSFDPPSHPDTNAWHGHNFARLPRQYRRIVDGRHLFEQICDVALPVARVGKPRKRARKSRVVPAVCDPRRVIQHAQRTQSFDQRELAVIELAKQLVAFHERRPGRLLAGRVAAEKHPEVLDARPRHAIVEIDEQRAMLAPQDVAGVAVAVDTHRGQTTKRFEGMSDSSDELFADARILLVHRLGYKATVHDEIPRLLSKTLQREARPMPESHARTDRVHARESTS